MRLVFNPQAIPRTTTRKQWRAIWRWKRTTERALAKGEAARTEALRQAMDEMAIYGRSTLLVERARDLSDRLIYPPVVVYPWK